jgi:hypothetical protein
VIWLTRQNQVKTQLQLIDFYYLLKQHRFDLKKIDLSDPVKTLNPDLKSDWVKPWQRSKVTYRRKRWLLKWRLWSRPSSRAHAAANPDLSRSRL